MLFVNAIFIYNNYIFFIHIITLYHNVWWFLYNNIRLMIIQINFTVGKSSHIFWLILMYSFLRALSSIDPRNRRKIYRRRKYGIFLPLFLRPLFLYLPAWFAIFAQTRQIFREGVFSFATRNSRPCRYKPFDSIWFESTRFEG